MTNRRRLAVVWLTIAAGLVVGCGPMETSEELQTLAGDVPQEVVSEAETVPAAGAAAGDAEVLDGFPLTGTVFPGLRGGLHSSLCDPASDPYSTCI